MSAVNIYKKFYKPDKKIRPASGADSSSSASSSDSSTMDISVLPTMQRALRTTYSQAQAGQDFPCELCGKVFPAKNNMMTHMRRYHKDGGWTCVLPGCGKTYKHK